MYLNDEELIIARAKRMLAFLASEDVQTAFDEIEAEFFAEFAQCRPEQAASLKHSWDGYKRLRSKLQGWADELAIRESRG